MFELKVSNRQDKKWQVTDTLKGKTVHFGAEGYSDYTIHKDPDRKKNYISRHRSKENWGKSGIYTAGFWSRWLLWNCTTLSASIKHTQTKFNIKIIKKK